MISEEAYIMPLAGAVVKARTDSSGKRIVEVEASSESVDSEGDIVLQQALLDAAPAFIRSGNLDIDHLSEIGHRIGLRDPNSYIVGRPMEVKDLGGKRTGVLGEVMRSKDGVEDAERHRFDSFWKSLQSEPPVCWSASIYGFPTDIDDCTEKACANGATRYVIKNIDWRSLAFTRNPINQSLRGYAKVVTAKAAIAALVSRKDGFAPFGRSDTAPVESIMPAPFCGTNCPQTMDALWGNYQRHHKDCPYMSKGNSVVAFKDHFLMCCGAGSETADILAHALMYMILRHRKQNAG